MKATLKRWLERIADAFRELDYSEAHRQAYDNYVKARAAMDADIAAERVVVKPVPAMDLFTGGTHSVMLLGKRCYVTHIYDNNLQTDSRLYSVFGDTPKQSLNRAVQLTSALDGARLL